MLIWGIWFEELLLPFLLNLKIDLWAKNMLFLRLLWNHVFYPRYPKFTHCFWCHVSKTQHSKRNWYYKSFYILLLYWFLKKNVAWHAHNRHKPVKCKICCFLLFFWGQRPIFVGQKMCHVCAHKTRKIFWWKYDKYVKKFYYYYFATY